MVQADISLDLFRAKAAFVCDMLAGGKQLEDSGGTYYAHLERVEPVGNHSYRAKEQLQVHDKGDQNTDLQIHTEHANCAVPNYQTDPDGLDDLGNREIYRIIKY